MFDIYTQAIQEAHPELAITSAQHNTADGQFNRIVVVNDELIFRFPRSEHVATSYAIHDALLSFLASQLPLPIVSTASNACVLYATWHCYRIV